MKTLCFYDFIQSSTNNSFCFGKTCQRENENQADLCQRYLLRQSSRLLMLHNLGKTDRQRLEIAAKSYVFEVERFYPFYPKVVDQKLMNTILVEARLRRNDKEYDPSSVDNRRDGVLYL